MADEHVRYSVYTVGLDAWLFEITQSCAWSAIVYDARVLSGIWYRLLIF
jgi:hypothetical protein